MPQDVGKSKNKRPADAGSTDSGSGSEMHRSKRGGDAQGLPRPPEDTSRSGPSSSGNVPGPFQPINTANEGTTTPQKLVDALVQLNKLCNRKHWTLMTTQLNSWSRPSKSFKGAYNDEARKGLHRSWSGVKQWAKTGGPTPTVGPIEAIEELVTAGKLAPTNEDLRSEWLTFLLPDVIASLKTITDQNWTDKQMDAAREVAARIMPVY